MGHASFGFSKLMSNDFLRESLVLDSLSKSAQNEIDTVATRVWERKHLLGHEKSQSTGLTIVRMRAGT